MRQQSNMDGLIDDVIDWGKSAWDSVTGATFDIIEKGVDYSENKAKEAWSNIQEFKNKMNELSKLQDELDLRLQNMPDGPEKARLIEKTSEARGLVESYVVPAWNKISSLINTEDFNLGNLGAAPIVWASLLAASVAAAGGITYLMQSIAMQKEILNDPAFSASQKTQLLSGGLLAGLSDTARYAAFAVGGVALIVILGKMVKR